MSGCRFEYATAAEASLAAVDTQTAGQSLNALAVPARGPPPERRPAGDPDHLQAVTGPAIAVYVSGPGVMTLTVVRIVH